MKGRVSTESLVKAGLSAMQRIGRPLERIPSRGSSKLYRFANGETVRMRTCNRHALVVKAEHPERGAKLGIEGTDWLLFVMPEREYTEGKKIAYLIPTSEAVAEVWRTHEQWLATSPATKGKNKTWTLEFEEVPPSDNYAIKWAAYGHSC